MSTPRLSNLLFLSGFAALAMPGCDSDSDDTETTASNATDGGTDGTTDPGGTTGTGGTTGSGATMDTSGTVSGTVTATGEPTTATAGGDGVCPALAAKSAECVPEYDYKSELNYCVELFAALEEYGADCVAAYEEALACASTLDCADFNAKKEPTACAGALDAAEEACGFGGSTGGSSGSDTDGGSGTDG